MLFDISEYQKRMLLESRQLQKYKRWHTRFYQKHKYKCNLFFYEQAAGPFFFCEAVDLFQTGFTEVLGGIFKIAG